MAHGTLSFDAPLDDLDSSDTVMAGGEGSNGPPSDGPQVWDDLQEKEAEIAQLQKRLGHFRAWIGTLHSKMQTSNPQAIKNARRLYIGGVPDGTTDVRRGSLDSAH